MKKLKVFKHHHYFDHNHNFEVTEFKFLDKQSLQYFVTSFFSAKNVHIGPLNLGKRGKRLKYNILIRLWLLVFTRTVLY